MGGNKCNWKLQRNDKEGEKRENVNNISICGIIKLLESPIPAAAPPPPSQKELRDDISGTKRRTIDPLVSKRPEKF